MSIESIFNRERLIAPLDLELLIAHATGRDRGWVVAHPEYRLKFPERCTLALALFYYRHDWPMAYILKHKEFYGLDFKVNRSTLIPRPETEILVDAVLTRIHDRSAAQPITFFDIGTGTGCIPISIAKNLKETKVDIHASDSSGRALRTAEENAASHKVRIIFSSGNLLEPHLQTIQSIHQGTVIISANLPYLTPEQFDNEASIQREPYSALVAPEKGLGLYRRLLEQLKKALTGKEVNFFGFFEIDPSQAYSIQVLIEKCFPNAHVSVKKDFCGRDRIATFSASGTQTRPAYDLHNR